MGTPQGKTAEDLTAANVGLFWLSTRKEKMGQWLSFADWREVNERINRYAPHLLVAISRRIPNIPDALGLEFDGPAGGGEPIISDLVPNCKSYEHYF